MKTTINLCLSDFISRHFLFFDSVLSELVEDKTKKRILHPWWPLNRVKTIEKRSKERQKVYLQYYTENSSGTPVTGCLIGDGRLTGGRLIGA